MWNINDLAVFLQVTLVMICCKKTCFGSNSALQCKAFNQLKESIKHSTGVLQANVDNKKSPLLGV